MKKPIDYDSIRKFRRMRPAFGLQDAICEASRCLLCEDAPCSKGCPAGTDPGKFIRQIRFANFKGAARTIRNNNVFGGVCAHTCPVEKLCEKECSEKKLGDPINISGLQSFACEYGRQFKLEPFEKGAGSGARIAVVGAGPAGASCAVELAKLGYLVTVFEKENAAGGIPAWHVPPYRLPKNAIEDVAGALRDTGVDVVFGRAIEGQEAVKGLFGEGFKACFISTGLGASAELALLKGYENVAKAKEFLRSVKFGVRPDLSRKIVAVVGGGSVAMDAAVTAAALGAKKVYVISLEGAGELPADKEEIELARGVNAIFKTNSQLTNAIGNGKRILALKGVEIEWMKPGNFSPSNAKPIEGTGFDIRVDFVIQAVGSVSDTIAVADDFSTGVPGVFAGGDIANGGATIAKAVGDGKKAAEGIHNFIVRGGK